MTKQSLVLTSLMAAVPGAILFFLIVLAFINYAGGWSFPVKGVALVLMLLGGAAAAMPAGIWLRWGPEDKPREKKRVKAEASAVADDLEETSAVAMADDELPSSGDSRTFEVDVDERDSEEFVETIGSSPSSEAIEIGDDFELDDDDDKGKKS